MTESIENIETLISDLESQRDQINERLRQARVTKTRLQGQQFETELSKVVAANRLEEIVKNANLLCSEVNDVIKVELQSNRVYFVLDTDDIRTRFADMHYFDYENTETIDMLEKWLDLHLSLIDIHTTLILDDLNCIDSVSGYNSSSDGVLSFIIFYKDNSRLELAATSYDDIKLTLTKDIESRSDMCQFCFEKSEGVEYEISGTDVTIAVTTTEKCDLESLTQTLKRMKDKLSDD